MGVHEVFPDSKFQSEPGLSPFMQQNPDALAPAVKLGYGYVDTVTDMINNIGMADLCPSLLLREQCLTGYPDYRNAGPEEQVEQLYKLMEFHMSSDERFAVGTKLRRY